MDPLSTEHLLDKLFSSYSLKDIDRANLIGQYDRSDARRQANRASKPTSPLPLAAGASITSIPPEGVLLCEAGTYEFANDVIWRPTSEGSAIYITSGNVVLDLKGHTLSASIPGSPAARQYNGISVCTSENVTVCGGNVKGMTYFGLCASASPGLEVRCVSFDAIQSVETTIPDQVPCGIFIDATDGFTVQDCTVRGMSVTAPSCVGIQMLSSRNGTVSRCTMADFQNGDGGVCGFGYLLCSSIATRDCTCQSFQSHYQGLTVTTGHTVLGYFPLLCTNLTFDDCKAEDLTGCCDDCHGMSVFLSHTVRVKRFRAAHIRDGVTPRKTGAKATGLEVYGFDVTVTDSRVEDIEAIVPQDRQCAGFSAWGMIIHFDDCHASRVKVTDASGEPSTEHGYGTGFGWAPDPRPPLNCQPASFVLYRKCSSTDCQVGFDTWFHTFSLWLHPAVDACEIPVLVQPAGTPRTLSMDKCSESPTGQYLEVELHNIARDNITVSP